MSADRTHELIERLAADATPVVPLPPLRVTAGASVLLGLGVAFAAVVGTGAAPFHRAGDGVFIGVLAGLLVAAFAGCVAGQASAIPGREQLAMRSACVAAAGLAWAVGAGALAVGGVAGSLELGRAFDEWAVRCLLTGAGFAAVSLGLGLVLARRAWPLAPWTTAVLLLVGTTAFGATTIQLICPLTDPLHVLVGHNGIPLLATPLIAPLAAASIRRFAG